MIETAQPPSSGHNTSRLTNLYVLYKERPAPATENAMWAGIISYLRRYVEDDEIISKTIEKAMTILPQFDPALGKMETWLDIISRTLHRNHMRDQREESVGGTEELDRAQQESVGTGSISARFRFAPNKKQWARVTNLIDRCILSSLLVGKTIAEVTVECGVTEEALRMRLSRLKQRTRKAS